MLKELVETKEITRGLTRACITEASLAPGSVRERMESAFAEMEAAGMSPKGLRGVLYSDDLMIDLLGAEFDSDESMVVAHDLLAPYGFLEDGDGDEG